MSTSTTRRPARTVAILLLIVGLGGYVVAAAADSSVARLAAANDQALGQKNAAAEAQTLQGRVEPIKSSYDTYAAASLAVTAARGEVTRLLSQVRSPSTSGGPEVAAARDNLPSSIAAYGAAIAREKVARQAYGDHLALLMAEMHR
jgi:hypothetical protein